MDIYQLLSWNWNVEFQIEFGIHGRIPGPTAGSAILITHDGVQKNERNSLGVSFFFGLGFTAKSVTESTGNIVLFFF
jgi:hypothetical protein